MIEIDARGLSCPIPVVKTKKAMEGNPAEILQVLVDADVARENVSRLASCRNYEVTIGGAAAGEYRLTLKPGK